MASETLNCWHCGEDLSSLPLPLGRRDECPHCAASLHVCRGCEFFDPGTSKDCREPVADEVPDKESANFCDYFRPQPGLSADSDPAAQASRAKLDELFGGKAAGRTTSPGSKAPISDPEAARAKAKLDALFGDGDET